MGATHVLQFARLLRHSLNISSIFQGSSCGPAISTVIKERRLRFAGHFHRATTKPIKSALFSRTVFQSRHSRLSHNQLRNKLITKRT